MISVTTVMSALGFVAIFVGIRIAIRLTDKALDVAWAKLRNWNLPTFYKFVIISAARLAPAGDRERLITIWSDDIQQARSDGMNVGDWFRWPAGLSRHAATTRHLAIKNAIRKATAKKTPNDLAESDPTAAREAELLAREAEVLAIRAEIRQHYGRGPSLARRLGERGRRQTGSGS